MSRISAWGCYSKGLPLHLYLEISDPVSEHAREGRPEQSCEGHEAVHDAQLELGDPQRPRLQRQEREQCHHTWGERNSAIIPWEKGTVPSYLGRRERGHHTWGEGIRAIIPGAKGTGPSYLGRKEQWHHTWGEGNSGIIPGEKGTVTLYLGKREQWHHTWGG